WVENPPGVPPIAPDCTQISPTFYSHMMLWSEHSDVYDINLAGYRTTHNVQLSLLFPDPGDGSQPRLWLDGLQRWGADGMVAPKMKFDGIPLYNRFDNCCGN